MFKGIDQNVLLSSPRFIKQKEYWRNKLIENIELTEIRPDDDKAAHGSMEKKEQTDICFPEILCRRLKKFSKQSDLSLYIVMLTGIKLLVYRYTGKEDIAILSPLYNANVTNETINHCLLIHDTISEPLTFIQLLLKIRTSVLEAYDNQDYPFEKIVKSLSLTEESLKSQHQSFSHIACSLKNLHSDSNIEVLGGGLSFIFRREEDRIIGTLQYDSHLYNRNFAVQLSTHFTRILDHAVANVHIKISDISFLSEEERERLVFQFNDTAEEYPKDTTIYRLFEEQTEKTPGETAVVFNGDQLTYKELNEKANQLARLLRTKGVKPGNIVGIMVDRSLEMIIGILGILKAGGAYMPINPDYPENRVITMLNECNVGVLVTKNRVVKDYLFTWLQNRQSAGKKVYSIGVRPNIKELDSLPRPDRSLVDYEKYNQYIGQSLVKNNIAMLGTRGCPYNCAFCHKIWPKTHVAHSAKYLFEEVKLYYHMGVTRFTFLDDVFNFNRKNSESFLRLIIEEGLDIQLFLCLRGDILTKDYIDLMIKAGTVRISLALETGSPRLQKFIGKNLHLGKFRENVEYLCEKYPQVILEINTIHGFPTETEDEAMMTLEFIKSLKWVHFPYVHILKIYNNTEMEKLALENGISSQAIVESAHLAYHELPETLPFDKSFTRKYQTAFFNEYFMSKERLLHVLPFQMKVLTEDEIIQKYNSYLPVEIKNIDDLLRFARISKKELGIDTNTNAFLDEESVSIPGFNEKLSNYFTPGEPSQNSLKVLLLDLSQFFSSESNNMLYDVVEPPLGLIYLLTCLKQEFGQEINGKIAKSRIDFDSYRELRCLVHDFKPDVIGVRTLTFYRHFFHMTIAYLRQWGIDAPIIAGGPYATADYMTILQDKNIDMVVIGEGEITFTEVIKKIMENNGKLPTRESLKKIPGLAFVDEEKNIGARFPWEIIMLDAQEEMSSGEFGDNPQSVNQPGDLAYVIFTSGSTGKPKGVMIEHRALNNLVQGLNQAIYSGYGEKLNVSVVSPYEFDASVKQIFGALLLGHHLFIVPENTRFDALSLIEFYKEHKIDISDGTPVHMQLLLEGMGKEVLDLDIKHFIIGGEALPPGTVERFFNRFRGKDPKITNVYGPTECCDVTSSYTVTRGEVKQYRYIPIGKPLCNVKVYTWGPFKELQPVGAPGELYIGGVGVGRGYLNKPQLTAEKFIASPFVEGEMLYRTGDLVRWLSDGNLEFLARIDHQVKIRGCRIELEDIESNLLKHKKVKEAVVVARKGSGDQMYICAYTVPKNHFSSPAAQGDEQDLSSELTEMELREHLGRELPDYMLPSHFVHLDKIPITPNGKIDKKALPEPEIKEKEGYIAPRNKVEEELSEIWAEVLETGKEVIGIDSNFFQLGGHSLKATIMAAKIHKRLNVKLSLAELFRIPTIRGIASFIDIIDWANAQKTGAAVNQVKEEIII